MFGQDIGIDLGTSTVLVYVKGRGIIDRDAMRCGGGLRHGPG